MSSRSWSICRLGYQVVRQLPSASDNVIKVHSGITQQHGVRGRNQVLRVLHKVAIRRVKVCVSLPTPFVTVEHLVHPTMYGA